MEFLISKLIPYIIFCTALFLTILFGLGAIKWFNNKRWPEIFKNKIEPLQYNIIMVIAILLWGILYVL